MENLAGVTLKKYSQIKFLEKMVLVSMKLSIFAFDYYEESENENSKIVFILKSVNNDLPTDLVNVLTGQNTLKKSPP